MMKTLKTKNTLKRDTKQNKNKNKDEDNINKRKEI